jgi:hypothetical protein
MISSCLALLSTRSFRQPGVVQAQAGTEAVARAVFELQGTRRCAKNASRLPSLQLRPSSGQSCANTERPGHNAEHPAGNQSAHQRCTAPAQRVHLVNAAGRPATSGAPAAARATSEYSVRDYSGGEATSPRQSSGNPERQSRFSCVLPRTSSLHRLMSGTMMSLLL